MALITEVCWLKERRDVAALQLAADEHVAVSIDAVHLNIDFAHSRKLALGNDR